MKKGYLKRVAKKFFSTIGILILLILCLVLFFGSLSYLTIILATLIGKELALISVIILFICILLLIACIKEVNFEDKEKQ